MYFVGFVMRQFKCYPSLKTMEERDVSSKKIIVEANRALLSLNKNSGVLKRSKNDLKMGLK